MDDRLPELHRRALAATGETVRGVTADQWTRPTPCEGWDARGLLGHIVSGNLWVDPLVRGETIEEVGDRYDGDQLGDDPVAAYEASARLAADAFGSAGAMEVMVAVSYGPVPGSVYAGHRFIDVLIHGWDLAVATGQDTRLDPELVEAGWSIFEPQADVFESAGATGPRVAVPHDADPQARLLALLGRRA